MTAHLKPVNRPLMWNGLAVLLTAGSLLIARAAQPAPAETTGIALGKRAPAFTLKDQNDHDVSLDALLKKGPVALVFYRSADW